MKIAGCGRLALAPPVTVAQGQAVFGEGTEIANLCCGAVSVRYLVALVRPPQVSTDVAATTL